MLRNLRAPALLIRTGLAILFAALFMIPSNSAEAQHRGDQEGAANFDLAARWAPYQIRDMVHSTTVEPNWIEGSEGFWYEWESSDGTSYYIVDPQRGTRTQLFDNDRIAAELTRITLDPWDGQHLPIRNIRFIDAGTLQFDVESSQDEETTDDTDGDDSDQDQNQEDGDDDEEDVSKKVHHFEYTVSSQSLRELEAYEAPNDHPTWASVSPDGQTVVFAKLHNLWMMSGTDYARILDARRGEDGDEADEAEEEIEVTETQLTTDGEEYYSYAANAPSEDRYTVAGAPTGPAAGLFVGVWDGNGGVGVSEYLAERAAGCYWEKLANAGKAGPEVRHPHISRY